MPGLHHRRGPLSYKRAEASLGCGFLWAVGVRRGRRNTVVHCSDQDLKGNSEIIEFFKTPPSVDGALVSSVGFEIREARAGMQILNEKQQEKKNTHQGPDGTATRDVFVSINNKRRTAAAARNQLSIFSLCSPTQYHRAFKMCIRQ